MAAPRKQHRTAQADPVKAVPVKAPKKATPAKPATPAQQAMAAAQQAEVQAAAQQVRAGAVEKAQTILRKAGAIAGVHFLAKPIYESKPFRLPDTGVTVIYRINAPGVALVIEKATGAVLAQSLPGDLQALAPGFAPGRTLAQTPQAAPRPGPH